MGDHVTIRRKIAKWTTIVREPAYTATLECGHPYPGEYDEPLDAEAKAKVGGDVICVSCTREENAIRDAEARVRELKARRRSPT